MSGASHVIERFRVRRRAFNALSAIFSSVLSMYIVLFSLDAYATTNEMENDYFTFVLAEIMNRDFPCSSGDIGHILYEDDFIAVLEIVCESGERYEIIDLYNMEDIIIQPTEKTTEEQMDNYFGRISHQIT